MKWQEHIKCSNPSLLNSTKATNAMEEYERKNKEEIHKELQNLDPIGSPHIEEILIGENIDLDLLSIFPKKMKELLEELRDSKLGRSTMEEKTCKNG
jgi:hypothetical protein